MSNATGSDANTVWELTDETSEKALEYFSDLRGGSDVFYKDSLRSIMAVYCLDLSDSGSNRYVSPTNDLAALDDDGLCLKAADFDAYPATYCEIVETCYWEASNPNTDRVAKITNEQAERNNLDRYYEDLGIQYLGTPIALGVINFLATLIFFIARCFFGKCSGRNGDSATETEYSKSEKLLPIFFFLLFSLAIVVLSAVAHIGNGNITDGLFDTTDAASTGLDSLEAFMTASQDTLTDIQVVIDKAVDEALVTLGDTAWVSDGASAVPDLLSAFSTKYASSPLLENAGLSGLGSALADAEQQSRDSIEPTVATFTDTLNIVEGDLVDAQDDIIYQTDDAIDTTNSLLDSIQDMKDVVEDLETTLEKTDLFRQGGVLALFGLTLFLIIIALIGIIAGLTPCKGDDWTIHFMNLTWMFGSLIATLAFLVGGASITISVFWSDVCYFVDIVTDDFGEYFDENTATGMNACFNDTGLIEAYNLTEQLDFAGQIGSQLDILNDLAISEELQPAYASISDVVETIESELNLEPLFNELNSLAVDGVSLENALFICVDYADAQDHAFAFTTENVREPWTVHSDAVAVATWSDESFERSGTESGLEYMERVYTSSCSGLWDDGAIHTAWSVAADTVQIKEDMLRDLGVDDALCASLGCPTDDFSDFTEFGDFSINGYLEAYEADLAGLQVTMIAWTDSVIGDAVRLVEDFTCNAYCGFMKAAYDSMHQSLCTTTLGGFQLVSLSLIALAVCNIPVVITSAIMVVRLRGMWMGDSKAAVYAE